MEKKGVQRKQGDVTQMRTNLKRKFGQIGEQRVGHLSTN